MPAIVAAAAAAPANAALLVVVLDVLLNGLPSHDLQIYTSRSDFEPRFLDSSRNRGAHHYYLKYLAIGEAGAQAASRLPMSVLVTATLH